jgi:hypothetical protein
MVTAAATHEGTNQAGYKSPKHAQVWFLKRSRDGWKRKYQQLKAQAKRLQNRVADVSKSRDRWRARAEAAELRLAQPPSRPSGEEKGGAS